MARELIVRGIEQQAELPEPAEFESLFGADLRYRVEQRIVTSSQGRQQTRSVPVDGDDDAIVELEDVDGIITFHRLGSLRATETTRAAGGPLDVTDLADLSALDLRGPSASGPGGLARGSGLARSSIVEVRKSTISLPASIAAAVATLQERLPESEVIGRLADVVIDPVARSAMRRIVDWVDQPVPDDAPEEERRRRAKVPGVYRLDERLILEKGQRIEPDGSESDDVENADYLLLIHGTFSHTEAAFGALGGTDEWRTLRKAYEGRLLALEHPTLGLSPAENALAAARSLPTGARLRIISHSRGGLVGDVLSLACGHEPDLRTYDQRGWQHPDTVALPELHRVLKDRDIKVVRFARVASPGSGTTLASRRIDRYATFLFNVLRLVPGINDLGVAAVVEKLLLTLLDKRSDPRLVPGIEAQMPESPFIAMLNTAPSIDDGLGAILGDIEGTGVLKRLKVLGADLVFREDNDLVVNTSAMSAGVPREDSRQALFRGGDVGHSSYFANSASRQAVADWISGTPLDVRGFAAPERSLAGTSRTVGDVGRLTAPSGIVLVVPDVFGSGLVEEFEGNLEPLWPSVAGLARTGVTPLGRGPRRAASRGELVGAYQPLLDRMRLTHEVEPYVYDWRAPVEDAARGLAKALTGAVRRAKGQRPVHVVTHGAGALLLMAAAHASPEQWQQVVAQGGRAIMLSPPLTGTWNASLRAEGIDRLCAALALVRHETTAADAGKVLAGLEWIDRLRPDGAGSDGTARQRRLTPAPDGPSDGAGWRLSIRPSDWAGWVAVYGRALSTPAGPDPSGVMQATAAGDGHVTYAMRLNAGPAEWFAQVPHHALVSDPGTIAGIVDLLSGADLSNPPHGLSAEEPVSRAALRPQPDQSGGLLFPTDRDLVWMAMGAAVPLGPRVEGELRLVVVHGSLEDVDPPVIVGTLDGTPIGGSEEALNRRLGGSLARHRLLNQYPGPLGTVQLFVRPDVVGPDAAVIGMGDAGDLTPSRLTAGISQAVLRLCAATHDAVRAVGPRGRREEGDDGACRRRGSHRHHGRRATQRPGGGRRDRVGRAPGQPAPVRPRPAGRRRRATARRALRGPRDRRPPGSRTSDGAQQRGGDATDRGAAARRRSHGPTGLAEVGVPLGPVAHDSGGCRTDGAAGRRTRRPQLHRAGPQRRAETTVNSAQRRVIDQIVRQSITPHATDRPDPQHPLRAAGPPALKGQGRRATTSCSSSTSTPPACPSRCSRPARTTTRSSRSRPRSASSAGWRRPRSASGCARPRATGRW